MGRKHERIKERHLLPLSSAQRWLLNLALISYSIAMGDEDPKGEQSHELTFLIQFARALQCPPPLVHGIESGPERERSTYLQAVKAFVQKTSTIDEVFAKEKAQCVIRQLPIECRAYFCRKIQAMRHERDMEAIAAYIESMYSHLHEYDPVEVLLDQF